MCCGMCRTTSNIISILLTTRVYMAERAKRPYKPHIRRVAPASSADLGSEEKPNPGNDLASTPMGTNMTSLDSFKCCRPLTVGSKPYAYYSLPVAEKNGLKGSSRLPFSMKVLRVNR